MNNQIISSNKIVLISITFVFLVSSIILMICLRNNYFFENLGYFKQPVCRFDSKVFEGDTCEVCERNILDSGVFEKPSSGYTYEIVEDKPDRALFSDYYNDYETYQSARMTAFFLSLGFMITYLVFNVFLFITLYNFYKTIKEIKNEERVLNK